MGIATTSTISAADLLSFSQNIAQLNLGYLGISVAILGVLGGVFVYFNIRPLKDSLDKQEKAIETLKKDAQLLLELSAEQAAETLTDFKVEQSRSLAMDFKQQEEKLRLETVNKLQEVEKSLSDRIEIISENKDLKLREIILSEANNLISVLEKDLTVRVGNVKEEVSKEITATKSKIVILETAIGDLDESVKELQVYKYGNEGKMGAILISIELLKVAVDYFERLKKVGLEDSLAGWKVINRLGLLIEQVESYKLEPEHIESIETQLKRIQNFPIFGSLVAKLRSALAPV